ncbi:MAG: hypothetical protein P8P30_11045 [Rickettsiales bacterium]|nr:hypothetical protein [Rickettsiales bacterium]
MKFETEHGEDTFTINSCTHEKWGDWTYEGKSGLKTIVLTHELNNIDEVYSQTTSYGLQAIVLENGKKVTGKVTIKSLVPLSQEIKDGAYKAYAQKWEKLVNNYNLKGEASFTYDEKKYHIAEAKALNMVFLRNHFSPIYSIRAYNEANVGIFLKLSLNWQGEFNSEVEIFQVDSQRVPTGTIFEGKLDPEEFRIEE